MKYTATQNKSAYPPCDNSLIFTIVSDFQIHGCGDIKTYYLDAIATKTNYNGFVGTFAYYDYLSSNKADDGIISIEELRKELTDDFRRKAAISIENTHFGWNQSNIYKKFDWLHIQGYNFSPLDILQWKEIVAMIVEIEEEQST